MNKIETDPIDWSLTTWEGSLREQLRRWSELPLESIVLAQEEMQELADQLASGSTARGVPLTAAPARRRVNAVTRVIRHGEPEGEIRLWENTTPEERMNAVWELTLQCMAWQPGAAGEPRLQRSVVRIQRARR